MSFKQPDRYLVSSNEDYEPDSNNQVLKNMLGIKSKDQMDVQEESELARTESELLELYDENHQFTVNDIRNIHQLWLGDITHLLEIIDQLISQKVTLLLLPQTE